MKNPIVRVLMFSALLCGVSTPALANHRDPFVAMLPVITPELKPGSVRSGATVNTVMQPLFIVGDDPLSHRWLSEKHAYLKKINATGMVVNVSGQAGWQRMKRYGLTVYPVYGGDFAKAFGLTHYPVLIEQQTIKQ